MSAITGFFAPDTTYVSNNTSRERIVKAMAGALKRRGPDHTGYYLFAHGGFAHCALACSRIHSDIATLTQPCTKTIADHKYTLLYDGFVSNLPELRQELRGEFAEEFPETQEEIILAGFCAYGADFVCRLRGAFSIALYDETANRLFLFRDQLGLCPLFYQCHSRSLIFASEPKGILAHPSVCPVVTREGLNEVFAMGPAHSVGSTLYKDMWELKPGHYLVYGSGIFYEHCYHRFEPEEHRDSYEETLCRISELLEKSLDTLSDVCCEPASLLSGGLDSSVITAYLHKKMEVKTFSFDFLGSKTHFVANSFQPTLDAPFVHEMVDYLNTDHTTLVCGNAEQFAYLHNSVLAHDGPAMADVDSSMLYFCEKIGAQNPIVFSGECADELFCGYPWYHNVSMFSECAFPWSGDHTVRLQLLNSDFINLLSPREYISSRYHSACNELNLPGDQTDLLYCSDEDRHRLIMYLTIRYFMQTLVDRADRIASYCSMDLRVPFADFDLATYLFNVPYAMKTRDGDVKHLLRSFAKGLIPETVRTRRKSPYPKTYDPGYESLLCKAFAEMLKDTDNPILPFLDFNSADKFLTNPKDYGKPWYGQLMAGPQLLAYYLQINDWLKTYQPAIELS